MESDPARSVDVRLEQASPLRGIVRFGDREPRPFEGWVALAAAVEAIVADDGREGRPRTA